MRERRQNHAKSLGDKRGRGADVMAEHHYTLVSVGPALFTGRSNRGR
jgi:hypothetical protein